MKHLKLVATLFWETETYLLATAMSATTSPHTPVYTTPKITTENLLFITSHLKDFHKRRAIMLFGVLHLNPVQNGGI